MGAVYSNTTADRGYCRALADDFLIPSRAVFDSLLGEPVDRAYKMARWAGELPQAERGKALRNWAKRHSAGTYAPRPEPEPAVASEVKVVERGDWRSNIPSDAALDRFFERVGA